MSDIVVTPMGEGRFGVQVTEGHSQTSHEVTVPPSYLEKLGVEGAEEERVVRESFSFLLDREPATSIMQTFELPDIEKFFEDYPGEIRRRLS